MERHAARYSMLEVHPPEQTLHSWTDFFIHIATIVLGLLIAIGLEQMVERLHEHYELRVAREALEREFHSNRAQLAADERDWLETLATLKNDLMVLEYGTALRTRGSCDLCRFERRTGIRRSTD
jgi:hypothetical protein